MISLGAHEEAISHSSACKNITSHIHTKLPYLLIFITPPYCSGPHIHNVLAEIRENGEQWPWGTVRILSSRLRARLQGSAWHPQHPRYLSWEVQTMKVITMPLHKRTHLFQEHLGRWEGDWERFWAVSLLQYCFK